MSKSQAVSSKSEGLRVVHLVAENVKKLKAVSVSPKGDIVKIGGLNGSGKSSLLDSIFYALTDAKSLPSEPVRRGANKATIKLDMGEIIVTKTITAKGGTTLTVQSADGAKFSSPQSMLSELLGAMAFDPLEFTRKKPEEQLEQLRSLVKLDVDIDKLDAQNAYDYEVRTSLNRDIKNAKARLSAMPIVNSPIQSPIVVDDLMTKIRKAGEYNAKVNEKKAAVQALQNEVDRIVSSVEDSRKRAQKLREEAARLERDADAEDALSTKKCDELADLEASVPEPLDVTDLTKQVNDARMLNQQYDKAEQRRALQGELDKLQETADALTAAMKQREELKNTTIANAKMPVSGLSFGNGEVTYNGLPLDQASSAQQLKISTAIAMELNPKIRVILVKDGSLLDNDSLKTLADMAADKNYQIWLEMVGEKGKVSVVMEDGDAVRGDDLG